MDDNAASTVIVAEVGDNGTLEGGDNTEDKDNADAVRGTSLLLNGTDDYIDLSDSLADLTTADKFTVLMKIKPNWAYDVSATQGLFRIRLNSSNTINLQYVFTTDRFRFAHYIGGVDAENSNIGPTYTSNEQLQQWMIFGIILDLAEDLLIVTLNGDVILNYVRTGAWADTPIHFNIGRNISDYGSLYVDEVKLYNNAILPYGGGPFHGNGEGLLADILDPHVDLSFYYDCQSIGSDSAKGSTNLGTDYTPSVQDFATSSTEKLIGSNSIVSTGWSDYIRWTVTSEDIVSFENGFASFWIWPNEALTSNKEIFRIYGDADNYIRFRSNSGVPTLLWIMGGDSDEFTSDFNFTQSVWNHVLLRWDEANDLLIIEINGQKTISTTALTNHAVDPTLVNLGRYAQDAFFMYVGALVIGKKTYTPDNWSVLGVGPRHMLIRDKQ